MLYVRVPKTPHTTRLTDAAASDRAQEARKTGEEDMGYQRDESQPPATTPTGEFERLLHDYEKDQSQQEAPAQPQPQPPAATHPEAGGVGGYQPASRLQPIDELPTGRLTAAPASQVAAPTAPLDAIATEPVEAVAPPATSADAPVTEQNPYPIGPAFGLADIPTVRMHTAPPVPTSPQASPLSLMPAAQLRWEETPTIPPHAQRPSTGPRRTAPPVDERTMAAEEPTIPPRATPRSHPQELPIPWNASDGGNQPAPVAPPVAPPDPFAPMPSLPQPGAPPVAGPASWGQPTPPTNAPTWGQAPDQASPRWSVAPPGFAPPAGRLSAGPASMSAPPATPNAPAVPIPTPAQVTTPSRQRATGAPPETPSAPPAKAPTAPPAPTPAPVEVAPAKRQGRASRVIVVTLLIAVVVAALGGGGAYLYGQQQAKAPTQSINAYCSALKQANYIAAYQLFSPGYQASISQQQYVSEQRLRDQYYGQVTACSASLVAQEGSFLFWRQPSLAVFEMSLSRAGAASAKHAAATLHGQVALIPVGTAWLVSAVDFSLQSVDFDPLTIANDFCTAMIAHHYATAYSLLSPPYQQEQGGEPAFAQSFGATLGITKCASQPQTLQVSPNDEVATMQVTLTGYGAPPLASTPVNFTLPANLTLVHLPYGWRIDTLTIPTSSAQN
ncbi:MAG TPA: hypothetical protein VKQ36_08100 [Ktedonobacterales bacterium]|nr:hypothetical protein [Ktedonobacterales bacterium]